MQTVNIDSNDFGEIRRRGYVYVDKTAWFHRLATAEGRKMFFLARPRRFGKSLMISTLEAMFQGKSELFEGLAIMDTDWDWKKEKRPVIHLNMGKCAVPTFAEFKKELPKVIKTAIEAAGAEYDPEISPSGNFGNAIDSLADKRSPPRGLRRPAGIACFGVGAASPLRRAWLAWPGIKPVWAGLLGKIRRGNHGMV